MRDPPICKDPAGTSEKDFTVPFVNRPDVKVLVPAFTITYADTPVLFVTVTVPVLLTKHNFLTQETPEKNVSNKKIVITLNKDCFFILVGFNLVEQNNIRKNASKTD